MLSLTRVFLFLGTLLVPIESGFDTHGATAQSVKRYENIFIIMDVS
jgi:hypothetical protein